MTSSCGIAPRHVQVHKGTIEGSMTQSYNSFFGVPLFLSWTSCQVINCLWFMRFYNIRNDVMVTLSATLLFVLEELPLESPPPADILWSIFCNWCSLNYNAISLLFICVIKTLSLEKNVWKDCKSPISVTARAWSAYLAVCLTFNWRWEYVFNIMFQNMAICHLCLWHIT